jgi:hypothetical protein
MTGREVLVRHAVIVAALIAAAVGAPWVLLAPLGLASLGNTGQIMTSAMAGADPVARWLLASMGVVVSLILMGIVLQVTPGGLTAMNWAAGWAILSVAMLTLVKPRAATPYRVWPRGSAANVVTIMAVLLTIIGAFVVANAGVRTQRETPLLEFSALRQPIQTRAHLLVRSVNVGGTYELRIHADGKAESGSVLRVGQLTAEGSRTLGLDVALPQAKQYWSVLLQPVAGTSGAKRKLILWK